MQPSSLLRRLQGPLLSSLIVMGGYVLSRLTGMLREVAISAAFGSSAELGAYRAAFKVTDLLYMVIIGGALGSSFIPVFIQVWEKGSRERAWKLASAVLTWALVLLVVASALLWLFAPPLVAWLYGGQGFDASLLHLTTQLTRLFLLSPLLLGMGGLAMAALNARERFALPALAPAIYNLGIMGGAIFLAPAWGIWGLAWGVVIGALFYLLVQIPGLWMIGMRLRPTLGRGMAELRTIASQMTPRVLGQSASQLSILVTGVLTARLALGAERLTGLDYAYQLMLLPYGVFSLSLSTVAFPRLARLFAEDDRQTLQASIRSTFRTILFLTLPSAAALMLLAVPVVRFIFQRYEFDEVALVYTVIPLLGYATALPAFAISEILIRTFYAMQQTWVPVLVGLLQVLLNLALGSLALLLGGGVGMLALAFSIANNVESLLLFVLLRRRLPDIWRERVLWRSVRASLAATALLAVLLTGWQMLAQPFLPFLALDGAYQWQQDMVVLAGWLAATGLAGVALYMAAAAAAGSHDARFALNRAVSIIQQRWHARR